MLPNKIEKIIEGMIEIKDRKVAAVVESNLKEKWDELVKLAVFGDEINQRAARWVIWETGQFLGIRPASIYEFYRAVGRGEIIDKLTVPAINLRGMVYDSSRAVFKAAKETKTGILILELARSEMGYTSQSPEEYLLVVMAGAIREDWRGGLAIQGDHFQAKAVEPGKPKQGELEIIKQLTKEAIRAGFYNIDIDMSTLVDLTQPTESKQQDPNVKYTREMLKFIQEIEPEGIKISVGGEIGHIGGKNSTVAEFEAYIKGLGEGLTKISVATGTHHGGVVLADGTMAELAIDFQVLRDISRAARKRGLAGAVQHGASTLPEQYFREFVNSGAIEVHLATEFQNIILDHPEFPEELKNRIYQWLDSNQAESRKPGQTDEQFYYETRKQAWGEFKFQAWEIPEEKKVKIRQSLAEKFSFLFKQLGVENTEKLREKWIKGKEDHRGLEDFGLKKTTSESIKGLAD